MRGALDTQITNGVALAGHLASSFKIAADDLDQKSPVAAGLVRSLAEKVEQFTHGLQGQTTEQAFRSASNFARQQPAVTFGLAALVGFVLFRAIKTAGGNDAAAGQYPEGPRYG
jgi:hypothetical protein